MSIIIIRKRGKRKSKHLCHFVFQLSIIQNKAFISFPSSSSSYYLFGSSLLSHFLSNSRVINFTMTSPAHFDDVIPNSPILFLSHSQCSFSYYLLFFSSQQQEFDFGGGFSGTRPGSFSSHVNAIYSFFFFYCFTHSDDELDTIGNKRSSPDFEDGDFDNDPLGKKVKFSLSNFQTIPFLEKPKLQFVVVASSFSRNRKQKKKPLLVSQLE